MPEEKKNDGIPTPLVYEIDLTYFEEDNEIDYEEVTFNLNKNVFYISSSLLEGELILENIIEFFFSTFHLLE
jgi:hypothetical protein